MQSRLAYGLAALLLAAGTTFAFATIQSAHGPLPSVTGAPAVGGKSEEANCTLCHFSDRPNLNIPGGGVEILGVPSNYTPGQTYPLTVRLHSDSTATISTRKWGFEITAVRRSDGEGVGTFVLPDPDTLYIDVGTGEYASREYLAHTSLGTRTGLGGPVQWTFSWEAPATAQDMIYFFCAGNAADGTDDPGNDFIFTTSDSTIPTSVHVPAPIATRASLAPPVPNPARGAVMLHYALAAPSRIELAISDVQGRKVRLLRSGWHEAGPSQVRWDGRRDDGLEVRDGVYFARLMVSGESSTPLRKIVFGR